MQLTEININNFRNITELSLQVTDKMTFIVGGNGAGKTSVIEAIYFLAFGRSFRSKDFNKLISDRSKSFLVTAKTICNKKKYEKNILGIEKFRSGKLNLKINSVAAKNFLEMAKLLPVQLINTNSYLLIEGEPSYRRKFLDWLLFHVEHSFMTTWQKFSRALKQRNAFLKSTVAFTPSRDRAFIKELEFWDKEFVSAALELDLIRRQAVACLAQSLDSVLTRIGASSLLGVELEYKQGWTAGAELRDSLTYSLSRDIAAKTTTIGPHRADLSIKAKDKAARFVLSRGQAKLLVFSMSLARAEVIKDALGVDSIFFIDDLASELDNQAINTTINALDFYPYQSFVTSIFEPSIYGVDSCGLSVFHVEQGALV